MIHSIKSAPKADTFQSCSKNLGLFLLVPHNFSFFCSCSFQMSFRFLDITILITAPLVICSILVRHSPQWPNLPIDWRATPWSIVTSASHSKIHCGLQEIWIIWQAFIRMILGSCDCALLICSDCSLCCLKLKNIISPAFLVQLLYPLLQQLLQSPGSLTPCYTLSLHCPWNQSLTISIAFPLHNCHGILMTVSHLAVQSLYPLPDLSRFLVELFR